MHVLELDVKQYTKDDQMGSTEMNAVKQASSCLHHRGRGVKLVLMLFDHGTERSELIVSCWVKVFILQKEEDEHQTDC